MINKNRGMFLENLINQTIRFYKQHQVAIFHKKNLDINFAGITEINGKHLLRKGYIKHKSTTDYYGIYQGQYIAFEAKSTRLHSLPIQSIKKHQLQYLQDIAIKHRGFAFLIIYFVKYNRVFMLFINQLQHLNTNKKSISLEFAIQYGQEIMITYPGIIDFVPFL